MPDYLGDDMRKTKKEEGEKEEKEIKCEYFLVYLCVLRSFLTRLNLWRGSPLFFFRFSFG
jgi:hypothetical protein